MQKCVSVFVKPLNVTVFIFSIFSLEKQITDGKIIRNPTMVQMLGYAGRGVI